MRAVNLLPRGDASQGRKVPLPVLVGCVGTVLVTALLAVLFLSASSAVASKRVALERLRSEESAIPAPPAPSPVVSQLPQERQSRVTALATVLGTRVVWDRLLREVSQVVPSDVWLLTLNALAPSLAPPSTGSASPASGFTVTGCTYSQDSVARFLARLQVVPDLSGMTLEQSVASDPTGAAGGTGGGGGCPAGMVTFKLTGNVRTAGAAS